MAELGHSDSQGKLGGEAGPGSGLHLLGSTGEALTPLGMIVEHLPHGPSTWGSSYQIQAARRRGTTSTA